MDIENVKYLFTITGGGWSYAHNLFVITKDDKIFHTEEFDDVNILDCTPDYMCDLYGEREDFVISVSSFRDKDGNRVIKEKYLSELLLEKGENGRVDFEKYEKINYSIMDAETVTLYKNVDNQLKELICQPYDDESMPAIGYVMVLCYHVNHEQNT